MNQAEETLEWQSVLEALRTIYIDTARSILGESGVVAFTDGACIKNPGGPAGWSVILFPAPAVTAGVASPHTESLECYGHIPPAVTTTNNRAEITAVLAALSIAPRPHPLHIYSDSEYTIKVAQGAYQMKANTDLWSMYRLLLNRRPAPTTFEWVRGHAGHDLNERADELAGLGAWNGNREAFDRWRIANSPEARNLPSAADMELLRRQVLKLKTHFDTIDTNSSRVSPGERTFITDMSKRLQKHNFYPSPKQINWLKALVNKFKL